MSLTESAEFALCADDPLIADLGPRPRPAPARGRHLLRHRGPEPGAAGAPARPRRQALPPLRRAVRLRPRLRRPPRPLQLPELRRRPARARRRRDEGRAARDVGVAGRGRDARGRAVARAPPPRPLQRLQRARGDHRRPALGRLARADPRRPGVDARGLRPGRDDRGRGQAGLDPADQEPRRARTRSCARSRSRTTPTRRRARASTSGSRSTTGSPTAATSRGSGTPTSSCSPAACAGSSARAPGRPRWRCA